MCLLTIIVCGVLAAAHFQLSSTKTKDDDGNIMITIKSLKGKE